MSTQPIKLRTGYNLGDGFYTDDKTVKPLDDQGKIGKYKSIRGMFLPKRGNGFDPKRKFLFQFNPEEITITKETVYIDRGYTGLNYTDTIWASGGPKMVTFTLTVDASAAYFDTSFGFSGANNIEEAISKKPRGVSDDTELLESFLVPEPPLSAGEIKTPLFSSGGIVPPNQFYPPPTLVFIYGNFYLEGVLKSASFVYRNFRKNLVPTRATIDISFFVFEQQNVSIKSIIGKIYNLK